MFSKTCFRIGKAIAKRLCQDGAKVMVSSRKGENVDKTLKEIRAEVPKASVEGTVCHVGKGEDRQRLVDATLRAFGSLDILVSNAGTNPCFGMMLDVGAVLVHQGPLSSRSFAAPR